MVLMSVVAGLRPTGAVVRPPTSPSVTTDEASRPTSPPPLIVFEIACFTEDRSSASFPELYASEQDAWDQVNHQPGGSGRHPSTWSAPLGRFPSWQAYAAAGHRGDYRVRPRTVRPASAPDDRPVEVELRADGSGYFVAGGVSTPEGWTEIGWIPESAGARYVRRAEDGATSG